MLKGKGKMKENQNEIKDKIFENAKKIMRISKKYEEKEEEKEEC